MGWQSVKCLVSYCSLPDSGPSQVPSSCPAMVSGPSTCHCATQLEFHLGRPCSPRCPESLRTAGRILVAFHVVVRVCKYSVSEPETTSGLRSSFLPAVLWYFWLWFCMCWRRKSHLVAGLEVLLSPAWTSWRKPHFVGPRTQSISLEEWWRQPNCNGVVKQNRVRQTLATWISWNRPFFLYCQTG